jgi:hypothetical protein
VRLRLRPAAFAGFASWLGAATAGAQSFRCGVERWPVKVLADHDSGKIDFSPQPTSISALSAMPIPEIPYPNDRRIAPHELRVYRVRAIVGQISTQDDRDWHIIVHDVERPAITMIVEIPAPECAATERHAELYRSARDSLRRVPRGGFVIIEGVGFFDFIHNQRGRGRNGFELHPVLFLRRDESPGQPAIPRE